MKWLRDVVGNKPKIFAPSEVRISTQFRNKTMNATILLCLHDILKRSNGLLSKKSLAVLLFTLELDTDYIWTNRLKIHVHNWSTYSVI